MNTDKRDSSGFRRFVPVFYPKISVHPRLSVVEKKFQTVSQLDFIHLNEHIGADLRVKIGFLQLR
jgi:hypothetical protein